MEFRASPVPIKTGLALNCGIRAAMVEHSAETAAYLQSMFLGLKAQEAKEVKEDKEGYKKYQKKT